VKHGINIDLGTTYKAALAKPPRRIRHTRNGSGWLLLVPLPLGFGLNIGTGYSSLVSLRSWSWARYDHADHIEHASRWATRILNEALPDDTAIAAAWESYTAARRERRWARRAK
jgi:hypothetical protein